MEEENDWGSGGACGAVEDVGAGGEGEVVYFDKGAGHFIRCWVGLPGSSGGDFCPWGDEGAVRRQSMYIGVTLGTFLYLLPSPIPSFDQTHPIPLRSRHLCHPIPPSI